MFHFSLCVLSTFCGIIDVKCTPLPVVTCVHLRVMMLLSVCVGSH